MRKNGKPVEGKLQSHKFIGPSGKQTPLPYADWMNSEIPQEAFALRTSSQQVITAAVRQGFGIGFVAEYETHASKFVEIISPKDIWSVSLWIVTHADLRRTLKVQEFLKFARA